MKIFYTFPYHKYFKTYILISNMHFLELHLDNFKGDFLNI